LAQGEGSLGWMTARNCLKQVACASFPNF